MSVLRSHALRRVVHGRGRIVHILLLKVHHPARPIL